MQRNAMKIILKQTHGTTPKGLYEGKKTCLAIIVFRFGVSTQNLDTVAVATASASPTSSCGIFFVYFRYGFPLNM